jgi:hypothetical protein
MACRCRCRCRRPPEPPVEPFPPVDATTPPRANERTREQHPVRRVPTTSLSLFSLTGPALSLGPHSKQHSHPLPHLRFPPPFHCPSLVLYPISVSHYILPSLLVSKCKIGLLLRPLFLNQFHSLLAHYCCLLWLCIITTLTVRLHAQLTHRIFHFPAKAQSIELQPALLYNELGNPKSCAFPIIEFHVFGR